MGTKISVDEKGLIFNDTTCNTGYRLQLGGVTLGDLLMLHAVLTREIQNRNIIVTVEKTGKVISQ